MRISLRASVAVLSLCVAIPAGIGVLAMLQPGPAATAASSALPALDPSGLSGTKTPDLHRGSGRGIAAEEPPAGLSREEWGQIRGLVKKGRYHAAPAGRPSGPAVLKAPNPNQGYATTFRPEGIELASRPVEGPDWRLGVQVVGYGPAGNVQPLPAAEPVAERERVEYRRGPLTEWYVNGPGGLEQGFTIAEAPAEGAGGPLAIELAVEGGLSIAVEGDGAVFADSSGRKAVRYAGLRAWDAEGKALPSRMEASGSGLRLVVDAEAARFPVTVDPIFVHEAKLEGGVDPIDLANDKFGFAVAVDVNTAVIGVPDEDVAANADQGSAYVFVRSGTAWTLQQKLTASGGAAGDNFGFSVSVSGNTVVVGAPNDTSLIWSYAGSAYVFVRSGAEWSQQQKLMALDPAASAWFGSSVSVWGDTLVIGADGDARPLAQMGSAYVFVRSGTVWSQEQKLIGGSGLPVQIRFGFSVSLWGNTVVVGAPGAYSGAGRAYVFVRSGTVWSEQQALFASDGEASDNFGYSVSGSGNTAVVGAPADNTTAGTDAGSAYVFVRSGTTWSQQQKLTASDAAASDIFGWSVSILGDTAVVGAYGDDTAAGSTAGSAYVFVRSAGVWSQQAKLTASDGATNDSFGWSVSISGNTAVVGAPGADTAAGSNAGSAYVFVRSGTVWSQQQKLTASDSAVADYFGISVSLSGNTAVVGAMADDTAGGVNAGSAYVFVRSGTTWTEQWKLTASDGAVNDSFGVSVSISGDTAVVGAYGDNTAAGADAGSAYVFVRTGTTWSPQWKLTASDGAVSDWFGQSVSVSGDTAVIGAPGADTAAGADAGSAYVFVRTGTTWSPQSKLTASDGAASDSFGWSVSVSGDTAVVGAYFDDTPAGSNAGSAYVFVRSGTTWSPQWKLTASDVAASDIFGYSVSISGNTAIVGAPGADTAAGSNAGSAYVFVRSGTVWSQQQKLTASDAAAGDQLGTSVSVSGDTAVIGARYADTAAGADAGAAYVFARTGTVWTQQQKLVAWDGAAYDNLGSSVAVSGDTILVGAYADDIGANADQGSAYVFLDDLIFRDGFE